MHIWTSQIPKFSGAAPWTPYPRVVRASRDCYAHAPGPLPPPPSPRGSKGQASPLLFKKLNHAALVCVCVCLSVSLSVSQWKEINSWKSPPQYIQNQFPWPIRSTGIHFISEIRSIAYSEIPSIKHSEILSIKHSEITSIAHSEILSIKHSEIPSIAHSASYRIAESAPYGLVKVRKKRLVCKLQRVTSTLASKQSVCLTLPQSQQTVFFSNWSWSVGHFESGWLAHDPLCMTPTPPPLPPPPHPNLYELIGHLRNHL